MFNKKTKIIVLAIAILFLSAILIFVLKIQGKKTENNNIDMKNSGDKITEDETPASILEELKKNHPEFTEEQFEFYKKTAESDKAAIRPCFGRGDEKDCIASVAFIKGDKKLCDTHSGVADEEAHKEEEESQKECVNAILKKKVEEEISQCSSLFDDDYFNCLNEIFSIYDELSDCANLPEGEGRAACEEIFYYKEAYLKYNRELCAKIKNEKLNQYCLKNIIDKLQDTDGDGLTDLDEINNYKTDYKNPDTDGDGYDDGEEIKKGFNPKGEGRGEVKSKK